MTHGMTRREFAATAAASLAGFGLGAKAAVAGTKTLRFIAQSDLRVLDPIWTTAGITRNRGLYSLQHAVRARPQVPPAAADGRDYNISADQLLYSFSLSDGLKFHDGTPVRGADCVASLKRRMARDSFGQSLATAVDRMEAAGDESFTIRLKEPFPPLLGTLAKMAGPAFIMPERFAETDPYQQVTEALGSGP